MLNYRDPPAPASPHRARLARAKCERHSRTSRQFYLYAPQTGRDAREKKRSGKESERRKRRNEEDVYSVDAASPIARFVSRFISGAIPSHLFSARCFGLPGVSRMQACPIHPRGKRRVTWIISIFAPAKVSRRDYRGATRFHPRQEERPVEKRGWQGPDCDYVA